MEEQLDLVERARTLDPDNLAVRTAYGSALLERGSRPKGQRELAWVVAKRPGDLGSSFRTHQGRLALLGAFFVIPGMCVLVAWLAARLQGMPAPRWLSSLWFASLIGVIIVVRIFEHLRTDRAVAKIKKDAHRQLVRGQAFMPSLRPLRWLLLAILAGLWTLFVLAAVVFTHASIAWRAATFLMSIPGWLVLLVSLRLWKRRREQIARGEPRVFDPSTCQCHRTSSVNGRRADAYVQRHLAFELSIEPKGIELYRCDLLGIHWLHFSEQSGLREHMLPAVLRLPIDFVPPAEGVAQERTGFYL